MRILCALLLLCSAQGLLAQSLNKDSLATLIARQPEDTAKINTYYKYGMLLENIDLDSAVLYYFKAKALAEKEKHIVGQIRFASNYSAVLNYRGQFEESYKVNKAALDMAIAHNIPLETAIAYTNVANVFNYTGRYDSAIVYYLKAADLFEKIGETRFLNVAYMNVSALFDGLKQWEKSVTYADKSVALSRKQRDSTTLSSVLVNKGNAQSSLKQYQQAKDAFAESLVISKKIGNTYNEHSAYISLANLHVQQNDHAKAISYFEDGLAAARKIGYTTSEGIALAGLANANFKLANYDRASEYIKEAISISEKTGVYTDLSQEYKLAADIQAHLGRHREAYEYMLKYTTLNDSLTNATVKNTVQELEKKYETAQKDKALLDQQLQLALSKTEIRKKQTWLWVSIAAIALIGIIFLLSYRSYRNKQKLQQQSILALQKEAEVIRLKATLEGQQEERERIAREIHDEIGSGLTSIVFLSNAVNGDNEKMNKIGSTARQLVNQMNEIVWSMSAEQDTLADLIAYMRHNISEMLNAAGMDYTFDIPDDIPARTITGVQRRNIYLAVKEAVHNSIKHSNANMVTITVHFENGITIEVEDNGKGMQQETRRKFGNGMKNMMQRMERTGGSFTVVNERPVRLQMNLPHEKIV